MQVGQSTPVDTPAHHRMCVGGGIRRYLGAGHGGHRVHPAEGHLEAGGRRA